MLLAEMNGAECFGFKDPRVNLLLPFWRRVFDGIDADVGYIIAHRHPLSVAHSLYARNGFELKKGCYLWLVHTLATLRHTAGTRRLVVDFDRAPRCAAEATIGTVSESR